MLTLRTSLTKDKGAFWTHAAYAGEKDFTFSSTPAEQVSKEFLNALPAITKQNLLRRIFVVEKSCVQTRQSKGFGQELSSTLIRLHDMPRVPTVCQLHKTQRVQQQT